MENAFNDGAMTLNTNVGRIRVIKEEDINYPGIKIYLDGELISAVECISETKTIRTLSYNQKSDEPINITNYNDR